MSALYLGSALKVQDVDARIARLEAQLASLQEAKLQVVRRDWLLLDEPELHLTLSDRSTLRVQWSCEYATRMLSLASTPDAEFVDCTAEETGLDAEEIAGYVDEVYRAVMAEESERMADEYEPDSAWER